MKIVMTLLVRDEEDIIDAVLEYHRAQGVDFFVVTDNLSVDGTVDYLRRREKEGFLRLLHEGEDDYSQSTWVTRMARMAYCEFGADWVINNDADEFWWPVRGTLRTTLKGVPEESGIVVAERMNFVPLSNADGPFYNSMIVREAVSATVLGKPLPPKVCHRGSGEVVVAQGNHAATGTGRDEVVTKGLIEILHFPTRSYSQLLSKTVNTGRAYGRNAKFHKLVGATSRHMYRIYEEGGLPEYWEEAALTEEQVEKGVREGVMVVDTRLREFFGKG